MTDDFDLKVWTLEVKEIYGTHTGTKICDELNQILNDWSLNKRMLTLGARDNASNGILTMEMMGINH